MASNPKIQLDNSPQLLSKSDQPYNKLRGDLEIDTKDVFTDNQFDLKKFNKQYEDVRMKRQKLITEGEKIKLSKLNITSDKKKLHELTIGELIFGMKDALFGILNDLIRLRFVTDTFTKNNRLFYIGFFIIIFVFFLYLVKNNDNNKQNIIELNNGQKYILNSRGEMLLM